MAATEVLEELRFSRGWRGASRDDTATEVQAFFLHSRETMSEMSTQPERGRVVAGIAAIQALTVMAIAALDASDLRDEMTSVRTRLLSRPPEQLLDQVVEGANVVWTFKPVVELLMRELAHLATAPDLSIEERRERVRWTLDVAGF